MYSNNWLKHKWLYLLLAMVICIITGCGEVNNYTTTSTSSDNQGEISRLEIVKNRGNLICGINGQLPGFSFIDESGEYSGMDVDICRALAASIFDDPQKVEYRNLTTQERFTAIQSGEVDILIRNTSWTISRDTVVGMDFAPPIFYDGQGIMTPKSSGIVKLQDLEGKSICVLAGTTTALNLAEKMGQKGISYTPIASNQPDAIYAAYQQRRCDAVTSDVSQLTARRSILPNQDSHIILNQFLSKEPLSPSVVDGDPIWSDVVRWTVFALIEAEEFGISSENITDFRSTQNPQIKRFLGLEGEIGKDIGLSNDFAARIIEHVGNYEEIYRRNIGIPFGLDRGLNSLWSDGGLLYAPPFR